MEQQHPEFELICAALESYLKSLTEACDDFVVEEVEQLIENAYEMLRQAEVLVKNHCPDPDCESGCKQQTSEHEDFTIECLSANFILNTDEGELSLELRSPAGDLMEVTEWVKCKAVEENGMTYYETGKGVPRLLRMLAAQISRKSKLAKEPG